MYFSETGKDRLQVRMSANVVSIDRLCGDMAAFLAAGDLSGLEFDMDLMLREALCNAILHGSGGDAGKQVHVTLSRGPESLTLRVRDEGTGWNWREHDWSPPSPLEEGGRGLYIVRHYSDGLEFNESGNEITIIKRYKGQEQGMDTTNEQVRRTVVMGQSLSAGSLEKYRADFKQCVERGVRELVLDCSALEIVDSMGIGLLVATHNSLSKIGGELIMANTSEPIYNLMSTM
ncbi:MAG: ATP-binding protein, partial [Desulfovibrio sp.]